MKVVDLACILAYCRSPKMIMILNFGHILLYCVALRSCHRFKSYTCCPPWAETLRRVLTKVPSSLMKFMWAMRTSKPTMRKRSVSNARREWAVDRKAVGCGLFFVSWYFLETYLKLRSDVTIPLQWPLRVALRFYTFPRFVLCWKDFSNCWLCSISLAGLYFVAKLLESKA